MTRSHRLPIASLAVALSTSLASAASAQEPDAPTSSREVTDDSPPPAPVRVSQPPDDLSGHFLIAPRAAWLLPLGSLDSSTDQSAPLASGVGFGLDLGYGISRHVDLHLRFDLGLLGQGDACPSGSDCSGRTTAFGLGAGYHLVNGASFDPWLQIGIGYRTTTVSSSVAGASDDATYSGIDWLHLAVGGDWYASRSFGFGPFCSFDLGSYTWRPAAREHASDSALHSFFSLGLRGVFDPSR